MNPSTETMDSVKEFYTQSAVWKGPQTEILDCDRSRAAILQRLCPLAARTVLELGAGDGATAAAMADLGYDVIAVEFSPVRATQAQRFSRYPRKGLFIALTEDFYTIKLRNRFDIVCLWDSFGLGSDADQIRLLNRISNDWLAPGGCVIMDVFNPSWWADRSGKWFRIGQDAFGPESTAIISSYDYDPLNYRFLNKKYPVGEEEEAVTQSMRCYTPADFQTLLDQTPLRVDFIEANGEPVNPDVAKATTHSESWGSGSYLVMLVAGGETAVENMTA